MCPCEPTSHCTSCMVYDLFIIARILATFRRYAEPTLFTVIS
nr:MAG TPA: hypothetical protein [Caudoviricetes sp.]